MSLTKTSYAMTNGAPLNVLDYGCVGDGSNNDTAAFQNALNAAQSLGRSLYVPSGTYLITSSLTCVEPIKLFGEWGVKNNGSAIIQYNGTGDCLTLGDTSSTNQSVPYHKYGFEISGLQIVGSSGSASGLVIWNASGYYSNLYVRNFDDYSIAIQQGWASSFQNVITHYSVLGGLYVNNLGGALSIISCAFLSHERGLFFNNTAPFSGGIYSVEVLESDFEGNTYGVYFGNKVETTFDEMTSIRFDTVHFENNTHNFYQASQCYLWGCQFNNANFANATSSFKSRLYNCTMDTPTFFGASSLECTNANTLGLTVYNPSFYTGYSGAGITGAAVVGTFIGTSGNIPEGSLLNQYGNIPGVLRSNSYANFQYCFLNEEQTSSGVVNFLNTKDSVYNIQVNESVSSVTANFTDTASNGSVLTLYVQTNNSGSLSKTVTITSTGAAFKLSSNCQTPSATTKVNIYTFVRATQGWLEISKTIGLDV